MPSGGGAIQWAPDFHIAAAERRGSGSIAAPLGISPQVIIGVENAALDESAQRFWLGNLGALPSSSAAAGYLVAGGSAVGADHGRAAEAAATLLAAAGGHQPARRPSGVAVPGVSSLPAALWPAATAAADAEGGLGGSGGSSELPSPALAAPSSLGAPTAAPANNAWAAGEALRRELAAKNVRICALETVRGRPHLALSFCLRLPCFQ